MKYILLFLNIVYVPFLSLPLSISHSFCLSLSERTIGIPPYLLTNSKHHSHQRLSSLIRSSKKRVIKVYQVRYELGEVREGERVQLTPLGYGTNACSNGSLITNYYRGAHQRRSCC